MEVEQEQLLDEEVVLPTEYLLHAGKDLPELTVEVLSAQTFQCSELYQKEERLLKLKAELRQTQQALDSTNKLVCSSVRAICLKEDLLTELDRDCGWMERELLQLALEKKKLEDDLDRVKKERETDESIRVNYKKKMDQYHMKMSEIKATPTQLEIEMLRMKIITSKAKRTAKCDVVLNSSSSKQNS